MFVCFENYAFDDSVVLRKVNAATIRRATQFAINRKLLLDEIERFQDANADADLPEEMEQRRSKLEDDTNEFVETIDDYQLIELITAIAIGEIEPESDGSYQYVGEDMTAGVGLTENQAKIAYVDARRSCE